MKKIRIGLIIIAVALFIAQLIVIYLNDWDWVKNKGSYIGLLVPLLTIAAVVFGNPTKNKN